MYDISLFPNLTDAQKDAYFAMQKTWEDIVKAGDNEKEALWKLREKAIADYYMHFPYPAVGPIVNDEYFENEIKFLIFMKMNPELARATVYSSKQYMDYQLMKKSCAEQSAGENHG